MGCFPKWWLLTTDPIGEFLALGRWLVLAAPLKTTGHRPPILAARVAILPGVALGALLRCYLSCSKLLCPLSWGGIPSILLIALLSSWRLVGWVTTQMDPSTGVIVTYLNRQDQTHLDRGKKNIPGVVVWRSSQRVRSSQRGSSPCMGFGLVAP